MVAWPTSANEDNVNKIPVMPITIIMMDNLPPQRKMAIKPASKMKVALPPLELAASSRIMGSMILWISPPMFPTIVANKKIAAKIPPFALRRRINSQYPEVA